MFDLIIIGGGPAGMTAAVYAARKKINTLMLAREIGGQVVWTGKVENYMGYQFIEGFELMEKFEQQLKQFPIDLRSGEEAVSVKKTAFGFEVGVRSGRVFQSRALIVATGKIPRRLNVPGEETLTGRGVSYCAVCDAPVFAEMDVAVVGGGNSALEAIDDLLKIASKVYSISEKGFTGDEVLIDRVKDNPKLVCFKSHQVTEIGGRERVESITFKNILNGEKTLASVSGIFVEIGLIPNSNLVKDLVKVNNLDEIVIDCRTATRLAGLFAAGDVTDTPEKQIIIAAGEGAKAALQAQRYLSRLTV
ncbi:MAG TPA: FAD-dependent oxidoreductase [Dehalococcoidales bacterium]|nr:FAD-dependent oxidoreductase [Dehalococcoidales bacterium]